jgi:hypothetical protein
MPDSSAFQAGYAVGAIVGVLLMLGVIGMGIVSIIMAFVRRTTGWIVAAIILSLLGAGGVLTGVVLAARGFGKAIAQQSKSKTVDSDDGWVRLEIPGTWSTVPELHDDASLKVGNKFREEYAVVLSEDKTDFDGTLDDYAKIATGSIGESIGRSGQSRKLLPGNSRQDGAALRERWTTSGSFISIIVSRRRKGFINSSCGRSHRRSVVRGPRSSVWRDLSR